MSRGGVFDIKICDRCQSLSMRLWPAVVGTKGISICLYCLKDAAEHGGYVESTAMGDRDINFLGTYGDGSDRGSADPGE